MIRPWITLSLLGKTELSPRQAQQAQIAALRLRNSSGEDSRPAASAVTTTAASAAVQYSASVDGWCWQLALSWNGSDAGRWWWLSLLREAGEMGLTGRRRSRRSGTRKESEKGRDGGSGCSGQVKKTHSRPETHTHGEKGLHGDEKKRR